jgi:hypothetical protein
MSVKGYESDSILVHHMALANVLEAYILDVSSGARFGE